MRILEKEESCDANNSLKCKKLNMCYLFFFPSSLTKFVSSSLSSSPSFVSCDGVSLEVEFFFCENNSIILFAMLFEFLIILFLRLFSTSFNSSATRIIVNDLVVILTRGPNARATT